MASGFNINVKVNLNSVNKILKDHGLNEDGRVQKRLTTTADRLMNPFIPFEGGNLRRLKSYPSPSKIKYTSPYSHYQYTGKEYISPTLGVSGIPLKNDKWWSPKGERKKPSGKKLTYHTPGTGPEWEKLMMEKKGKELIRDIQNYIKRG